MEKHEENRFPRVSNRERTMINTTEYFLSVSLVPAYILGIQDTVSSMSYGLSQPQCTEGPSTVSS